MRDAEVIVVGGSIGGAAAAAHLGVRGHEVLILERARFPREKVCGEGLMPYGVSELLRLGVRDAVLEATSGRRFAGIGYRVGGERAVGLFPKGYHGLGLRRSHLDAALAGLSGPNVQRREGVAVTGIGGCPGRMEVHTRRGVFRCSAVVGADGMRSGVRRALGLERPRRGRNRYGVRAHLQLPVGTAQLSTVEVVAAPGLEFYLTPVTPRQINVAVLLEKKATRAFKGDLRGGFETVLRGSRLPWLQGELVSEPMLTGPLRNESRSVVADGALLVGDAAGFLDGITGEGMSLALLSARLGAEVLSAALHHGDLSRRALVLYQRRRARASRELLWFTEIVLAGIRNRRLAARVVRGLRRNPAVFERLLAVNTGTGSLRDVGLRGLLKVLT